MELIACRKPINQIRWYHTSFKNHAISLNNLVVHRKINELRALDKSLDSIRAVDTAGSNSVDEEYV